MPMKKMSKRIISLLVLLCFSFMCIVTPIQAEASQLQGNNQKEQLANRFIVKYKQNNKSNSSKFSLKSMGYELESVEKNKNKDFEIINTKTEMSKSDLLTKLKADAEIEYVHPDYKIKLSSKDAYFNSQWGLGRDDQTVTDTVYSDDIINKFDANVSSAWNESEGKDSVVAIIDTGIDITHEDLSENIWINKNEIANNGIDDDSNGYVDDVNGWNFNDNNNVIHSKFSSNNEIHGTHIAGIIGATKDNEKGIAGVAPKAKIIPLKVFKNGEAYTSDIINAIQYAERMGAKIVNCSWGDINDNPALKEAMEKSNMLFVCAAGNSGTNIDKNPVYPASFDLSNIITVASINQKGDIYKNSNYGENVVDVAAPGEEIISTLPSNAYGKKNGTSMAAAFVSGEAALLLSKYENISAEAIKDKIINSSDRLYSLMNKVYRGNKINCKNAVYGLSNNEIIQATGVDPTVTDSVYNAVYGGGFKTFADGNWAHVGESTASIVSVPAGNVKGQVSMKIGGRTIVDKNSVKSTFSTRIKSVGKNLCPDSSKKGIISSVTGNLIADKREKYFVTDFIKLKPLSTIYFKNVEHPNTVLYDANRNFVRALSGVDGYTTLNEGETYIRLTKNITKANDGKIMLAYEDIPYEPYTESTQYSQLPDGMEMHNLPNGIKDEVKDGKLYKRVGKVVLDGSENWQRLSSVDTKNTYCIKISGWVTENNAVLTNASGTNGIVSSTDEIYKLQDFYGYSSIENDRTILCIHNSVPDIFVRLNKTKVNSQSSVDILEKCKNYLKQYPIKLIYQLVQPKTIKLNTSPLICYPNGTLIIDRAVKNTGVYGTGGLTVKNKEIPIKFLESVYKISGGTKIPVDMRKVHIVSNGHSFTIDGANKEELYEFVYQYDSSLGTLPSIEFSVPMNTEAQVDGNTDMIQNLTGRIEILEEKVKTLQGNTVGTSGTMNYVYDDNGRLTSRSIQ